MFWSIRTAFAVLLLMSAGAVHAHAQIDYRNLDDERPVRTEDAYPIERFAVELLTPLTFEATGGVRQYLLSPEFAYSPISNSMVGVKLPVAVAEGPGGTRAGLGGSFVYAFYNFNTESKALPALALRTDVELPIGSEGGTGVRATLKALATRSWGRWRAHLNLAGTVGSDTALGVDALPRWSASLAVDHTLYRHSVLLIGDVAVLETARNAPTQVEAALGLRWQWRPTTVLDTGLRRRLTAAGPNVLLTIGLSQSLAFRGLMPKAHRTEASHAQH